MYFYNNNCKRSRGINTDYFLEFQRCVCYKVNWKITCWVFSARGRLPGAQVTVDVVCVARYLQNIRERLQIIKSALNIQALYGGLIKWIIST